MMESEDLIEFCVLNLWLTMDKSYLLSGPQFPHPGNLEVVYFFFNQVRRGFALHYLL